MMFRLRYGLLVMACGVAGAGCSGRHGYDGAQRFAVKGNVAVDGVPMELGTISFIPMSEEQRVSGGPIEDGVYTIPEAKGPNAGAYRIEIRWSKGTGKEAWDGNALQMYEVRKEGLPPRYHAKSELTADVSEDKTEFNFDLKAD